MKPLYHTFNSTLSFFDNSIGPYYYEEHKILQDAYAAFFIIKFTTRTKKTTLFNMHTKKKTRVVTRLVLATWLSYLDINRSVHIHVRYPTSVSKMNSHYEFCLIGPCSNRTPCQNLPTPLLSSSRVKRTRAMHTLNRKKVNRRCPGVIIIIVN